MAEWVAQGSPEWIRQRIGYLTASRMAIAMDFLKSGKESEARKKLKFDILAERLTDAAVEHYVTDEMRWGIENEPSARETYEAMSGSLVMPMGFVPHPTIELFGASPDGAVDADGLVEFKCPKTTTHIAWMLAGQVPEQHKPQMLAQLACTRRQWVDFVSYDPRVPEAQQLFVRRFQPKPEDIAAVEKAAQEFLVEVEAMFEQLTMKEAA